jgi:hypothetical protein
MTCSETFIPADEDDLEHVETAAGAPCGGSGIIIGQRSAGAPDLSDPIEIRHVSPHAEHPEVTITMTAAQLRAIRNTLSDNVDIETVAVDNYEPERAVLLIQFIKAVDKQIMS